MTSQILSPAQANFKMSLWQAEADSKSSNELYIWLNECGLPHEVTMRLHDLASYTKRIDSKIFYVGKILLLKIIDFVKAHPSLVTGFGIGCAVGAAVSNLIISVPFFGQLLAPVAMALGITITAIGAVAGHRIDKRGQGKEVQSGIFGIAEDIIEITKIFFELVVDVFNVVFSNIITA
ncbi:MAG: hypothetical protein EA343_12105 [Nodularia sp. (in: Bacteria)]|nr:MAG: hypothetical protein EA343_12105 [Nodularia sp. (in: cyanobacteria)]